MGSALEPFVLHEYISGLDSQTESDDPDDALIAYDIGNLQENIQRIVKLSEARRRLWLEWYKLDKLLKPSERLGEIQKQIESFSFEIDLCERGASGYALGRSVR
jgi:hypothetical protein